MRCLLKVLSLCIIGSVCGSPILGTLRRWSSFNSPFKSCYRPTLTTDCQRSEVFYFSIDFDNAGNAIVMDGRQVARTLRRTSSLPLSTLPRSIPTDLRIPTWATSWELVVSTDRSLNLFMTTNSNVADSPSTYELLIESDGAPCRRIPHDTSAIRLREHKVKPSSPDSQRDLRRLGIAIDLIDQYGQSEVPGWTGLHWWTGDISLFYYQRDIQGDSTLAFLLRSLDTSRVQEHETRLWIIFSGNVQ